MERSSFADFSCSIARTLEVVGEWWTLLIVRDLFLGFDRFDEIQRDLGLASNVLTARLKHLLEQGIIERQADSKDKRVWRYCLSERGRDLYPVLLALTAWGDKWASPEDQVPLHIRHLGCSHITAAVPACAVCGEVLHLHELVFEPGPGGRDAPGTALASQVFLRQKQETE
ncbi:winged helix-turn-helix transcriptional regulator [Undibacterium sp. TJN19]|uniref:winged helix-turn-helix transcriptional regulator n=1 Tax=Undibacterium sp. TJN19 TaxID=3413055 RepID=UPI003BF1ADEB